MPHSILVLGGSNFMGKDLLQRLSSRPDNDVHYINRGRIYWNNEVKSIPNVSYSYGNRDDKKDFTSVLRYLTRKLSDQAKEEVIWDAVIDFSAFTYKQIKVIS